MDSPLDLILLLFHWRFLVSVVATITLAFFLSSALTWFTAGYCLTLVLFGTAFGFLWQGRASAGVALTQEVSPMPISKPVAFLGFIVIGFFWGGIAAYLLHSVVLGGVVLVSAVGSIGLWYRYIFRQTVSLPYLLFAAVSLLVGYGGILMLTFANN